jgi:hypothetical protein
VHCREDAGCAYREIGRDAATEIHFLLQGRRDVGQVDNTMNI